MTIRLKRRTLLAYVLSLSSVCLLLWVVLFIVSDQQLPSINNIELTAEDRVKFAHEPRAFLNLNKLSSPEKKKNGNPANLKVNEGQVKSLEPANNKQSSDVVLIPDNTALRNMSWQALSELYHRYLSVNQVTCQDIARVGRVTDGGWNVCNDEKYKPKDPCVVYSFGIGDDFSFDDAMVRNYGCKVLSFDPSISAPNKRGEKSFFYKQGLADSDRTLPNGWVMSRFETIRLSFKHNKVPIHTVKMDIEEWEWEVLPDLLTSDQLKAVTQILIELHQCEGCSKYNPEQDDKEASHDRYIHMLELLNELYRQGFRIFHHHDNPACQYLSKFTMTQRSACSEMGFLKVS